MEGKFRSINFKVWQIIATTIIIFFATILVINITVIKKMKNEFILDQLMEKSELMKIEQEMLPPAGRPVGGPPPENFRIEKGREGFEIIMDPFTRDFYRDKKSRDKILDKIVNRIIKNKDKADRGTIEEEGIVLLYYVEWNKEDRENHLEDTRIFLVSIPRNSTLERELFSGGFILFILSFFISRIISKKIVTPVQKLTLFAEEIAKRNWEVEAPITENDEIGILTQSLEKMRDSLKVYEERDREFLQSTSHDLKTPVMVIKGYAESIIDGITINSEKSGAEVIKAEAERLERKITQLLRLNTLRHSLDYNESEEVRVDRILKNLISKFKVINPKLKWIVDLKELEIQGDSEALLIAFENIIENQLRFAKSTISVSMDDKSKGEILISNDGPNFEVDDPDILFETYTKDRLGKFGLGLSIVKQVIRSHKGSIEASNLEKGVQFKINLLK